MTKEMYFKALDLYNKFCELCIDELSFESFTLEEQNDSFIDFINKYSNCEMDDYRKILFYELSNCKDTWSNEEFKTFSTLLYYFNLRCETSIEY